LVTPKKLKLKPFLSKIMVKLEVFQEAFQKLEQKQDRFQIGKSLQLFVNQQLHPGDRRL
jgi:hypothetical protein